MALLEKATIDQKEILGNLLEFYVYEFTKFVDIHVDENGRYGFESLDSYFLNPNIFPYFIKKEGKLAGFVIVSRGEEGDDFDFIMNEFFVMNRFMGKGVSREAAIETFNLFQGKWMVVQMEKNYRAQTFWRKVIKEYTDNAYEEFYDEKRRSVQKFRSGLKRS
ncbi:GNAT family N-acetyltransferase [Peribacillus alkalitolerans]|uniref:GNAT family N-acetyltransferase n=1 Tax=Peribacillus alkalitolerans TaxID=1550385 RepID=UPI0013D2711B|nr:GNAT family N-acetyltransferase [Peribacillus alkalitolerans]